MYETAKVRSVHSANVERQCALRQDTRCNWPHANDGEVDETVVSGYECGCGCGCEGGCQRTCKFK